MTTTKTATRKTNATTKNQKPATETKKVAETKKEEKVMLTPKTETKKAAEKKAEPKRTLDTVKNLLTRLTFEHTVIDVKPGGVGVKEGKTRVCAIYLTRTNDYRLKTNKLSAVDAIIDTYATTVTATLTSDKRDYLITGKDLDDAMLLTLITELCGTDSDLKKAKKAEKAAAKEAKKVEKEAKKAEKKAKSEKKADTAETAEKKAETQTENTAETQGK